MVCGADGRRANAATRRVPRMEDSTAAVEAVVAGVVAECQRVVAWAMAHREADLRTLEGLM